MHLVLKKSDAESRGTKQLSDVRWDLKPLLYALGIFPDHTGLILRQVFEFDPDSQ